MSSPNCAFLQEGYPLLPLPIAVQITTTNPWLRLPIPRGGTGLPWRVTGGWTCQVGCVLGCVFGSRKGTFCRVLPTQVFEVINLQRRAPVYASGGQRFESSWAHDKISYVAHQCLSEKASFQTSSRRSTIHSSSSSLGNFPDAHHGSFPDEKNRVCPD